jgi:hypothetical protein
MKINFTSIAALLLMLTFGTAFGQTRQVFGQPVAQINPKNGLIRCVSSEYEKYLQEKYSDRMTREQFEQWIAPKVAEIKERMATGRSVSEVITIPVVVHVIHNGDAVGVNENISNARVLSQITVLNQDFRRMLDTPGFNDNTVGADVEIEFCMAQRKPDGTATNGIDRVNLGVANWTTEEQVEGTIKPSTIWDPSQYFNIWTAQFTTTNTSAYLYGVLGYAQFPYASGIGGMGNGVTSDDATTDGVIIDWRCFGSSDIAPATNYFTDYDKGRTATHEIGHCLGLIHIWGDTSSCTVNATDSNKDYCLDTPAANDANYDCFDTYDSCPLAAGNDMTENYMDYSNDTCMNTFTLNQKARMIAVMNNANRRASLKTSIACSAPLANPAFDIFDGINLYPNPANDFIAISMGDSSELPDSYTLYNAIGQKVAGKSISSGADLTITTSGFSNGVYFLKVIKDNAFRTLRFVKN